MIYIVLFFANVKFLRILRFNRRISMIISTMYYGWKYMLAFTFTLLLVFMAYAFSAFLFFGTTALDFMNFASTCEALWVVMLSKIWGKVLISSSLSATEGVTHFRRIQHARFHEQRSFRPNVFCFVYCSVEFHYGKYVPVHRQRLFRNGQREWPANQPIRIDGFHLV